MAKIFVVAVVNYYLVAAAALAKILVNRKKMGEKI